MAALMLSVLAVRQSDSWPIWEKATVMALADTLNSITMATARIRIFFI